MSARKGSTRKPKATPQTRSLSSVVNEIATTRGIDASRVGKRVRAHIRGNYDALSEDWTALAQKDNKDGNRYPDMPADVATSLVERFTRTSQS